MSEGWGLGLVTMPTFTHVGGDELAARVEQDCRVLAFAAYMWYSTCTS